MDKYHLFPNSFSYGVLANTGSGAPNHGFREGSGAGPGQGSGKVPGQYVPQTLLRITPGLIFFHVKFCARAL